MSRFLMALLALGAFFGIAGTPGSASAQNIRQCESSDERRIFCPMNTRGEVRIFRQLSQTPCVRDRTYNVRRDGVVVRRGCRAVFVNASYRPPVVAPLPGPVPGFGLVRCEALGPARRLCPMDRRAGVELVRQTSGRACVRGETWGVQPGGIWVERGCRGIFGPRRG